MTKKLPIINEWYQHVEEDQVFEVVAFDEDEGLIEVQYADGEVGEFDLETWRAMVLLPTQAPEDWRQAFELGSDEAGDPDTIFTMSAMDDPIRDIEPDSSQ